MSNEPPQFDDWLKDGEPDWERINFAVPCSRCGYELRMLTVPRCPECGLTFTWPDVIGATVRRSQFLFEHRWHDRMVRSWVATMWRGLRPWRFWRDVSLHEYVQPVPLVFLLLTAPFVMLVTAHIGAGLIAALAYLAWLVVGGDSSLFWGWRLESLCEQAYIVAVLPFYVGTQYAVIPAVVYLMLAGMLGLVCTLQETLGRCRVRFVQILRVFAYIAGPLCVLTAATILLVLVCERTRIFSPIPGFKEALAAGTFILPIGVPGIFLAFALGRYLHLPRAWLIGPTAALVGWLFVAAVMVLVRNALD